MKKKATSGRYPPYGEIVSDLIESIMRAQSEFFYEGSRLPDLEVPDKMINRHFIWLSTVYREGENRHLFDATGPHYPLRTRAMRNINGVPDPIKKILTARQPLPIERSRALPLSGKHQELSRIAEEYIPAGSTRISQLVRKAFAESLGGSLVEERSEDSGSKLEGRREKKRKLSILIRSPLSIAYEYLTIPSMPGSQAYALHALRNYIFESLNLYPEGLADLPRIISFSTKSVEAAVSHVWTSLRDRHWSTGQDKLPYTGRKTVDGLVRHFLAMKSVLWLRFEDLLIYQKYLGSPDIRGEGIRYEFARSPYLQKERISELGELINEFWGIPVPIRGGDTIFRGGLRFSSSQGLVMAVHGGPGSGKTTLALALGAFLAPFHIKTLFITAEEIEKDLRIRAETLVPDEVRRLSFFPESSNDWLSIAPRPHEGAGQLFLESVEQALEILAVELETSAEEISPGAPKACRAIVVLDGLHDLFAGRPSEPISDEGETVSNRKRLRSLIARCRQLRALVILTTAEMWADEAALDYLVDTAMKLSHDSVGEYGKKPDRRLLISKSRFQLCAGGTHGLQIAGSKGVRFSPQINYQLDRRAIWKTRLADTNISKDIFCRALYGKDLKRLPPTTNDLPAAVDIVCGLAQVELYRGSNIFLNGRGSGGKASLALKIAISPSFNADTPEEPVPQAERVLIVSFLYPAEYYLNILERLVLLRRLEYKIPSGVLRPRINVIHLYPGHLKANDLFNRIEWELDAADLQGDPYTTIVIDGIHNVFLQFPEIEAYVLFWPQIYSALRSRPVTIITTHSTLAIRSATDGAQLLVDDNRSEPLRHALVQKTDFQFEIDPTPKRDASKEVMRFADAEPNSFYITTQSAINQAIPTVPMLWSREKMVLFVSSDLYRPSETQPALFSNDLFDRAR